MAAYYNEIDDYAAEWLRNLIKAGLVPDGEVDTRSIVDVRGDDLRGFTQCHFFAGIAGWPHALRLAGWPDDRPVWTGSCPCQPFSLAGKQAGFDDPRHLWPVWRELVRERHPATILGEQVASATEWLRLVRGDLEAMGYAVGAMPIQAASAGAFHLRDRYWFVADDGGRRRDGSGWRQDEQPRRAETVSAGDPGHMGFANGAGRQAGQLAAAPMGHWSSVEPASGVALGDANDAGLAFGSINKIQPRDLWPERAATAASSFGSFEWVTGADGKSRPVEPGICLLADGVPNRVAKLRAFGNAIVPQVAAEFIRAVM